MKSNNIRNLIAQYFEGELSIAELRTLKKYFASESIESEFEQYKAYFISLENQAKTKSEIIIDPDL